MGCKNTKERTGHIPSSSKPVNNDPRPLENPGKGTGGAPVGTLPSSTLPSSTLPTSTLPSSTLPTSTTFPKASCISENNRDDSSSHMSGMPPVIRVVQYYNEYAVDNIPSGSKFTSLPCATRRPRGTNEGLLTAIHLYDETANTSLRVLPLDIDGNTIEDPFTQGLVWDSTKKSALVIPNCFRGQDFIVYSVSQFSGDCAPVLHFVIESVGSTTSELHLAIRKSAACRSWIELQPYRNNTAEKDVFIRMTPPNPPISLAICEGNPRGHTLVPCDRTPGEHKKETPRCCALCLEPLAIHFGKGLAENPTARAFQKCNYCLVKMCNRCVEEGHAILESKQGPVLCPKQHPFTPWWLNTVWYDPFDCRVCLKRFQFNKKDNIPIRQWCCYLCRYSLCESCYQIQPEGPIKRKVALVDGQTSKRHFTRAVIIGDTDLDGCIHNINTQRLLFERLGYTFGTIHILCNHPGIPGRTAGCTVHNVRYEMDWLCRDAVPGEHLLFCYSGHGSNLPDENGDEADGRDEAIVPEPESRNGYIIDDELYKALCAPLPEGTRLTALFDACSSGTMLDLPYVWKCGTFQRDGNGDIPKGNILCITGCRDDQKSSETSNTYEFQHNLPTRGQPGGAFTNAIATVMLREMNNKGEESPLSVSEFILSVSSVLRACGYSQEPQLSSSRQISPDTELSF